MSKRPRQTPFCTSADFERMKAAKRRELERRGRPIPIGLLPTEPIQINMAEQIDNREPKTSAGSTKP